MNEKHSNVVICLNRKILITYKNKVLNLCLLDYIFLQSCLINNAYTIYGTLTLIDSRTDILNPSFLY